MNSLTLTISLLCLLVATAVSVCAQVVATPTVSDSRLWQAFNRTATHQDDHVHLDKNANDGVLWLKDVDFRDGTIEFEVKGEDVRGQSFVGIAFHGLDDRTFDAVYFRPFNFLSPERRANAVQYIAMPGHDWSALRRASPGKYESAAVPTPNPEEWFHVKVVVKHPDVTVHLKGATEPTLQVTKLSERVSGRIGFWVGNGSEGWFRNLRLTHAD